MEFDWKTNVRHRMYFPIIMPINADGQGPVEIDEATEITFEVWDQVYCSHGSHKFLLDAVQQAEDLNREYHKGD